MMDHIQLICKRVKFYSKFCEDAFFEWLLKIKCVTFKGVRDTIVLTVDLEKISEDEFWELDALFRRYRINRKQLESLIPEENIPAYLKQKRFHRNVYPA